MWNLLNMCLKVNIKPKQPSSHHSCYYPVFFFGGAEGGAVTHRKVLCNKRSADIEMRYVGDCLIQLSG